MLIKFHLQLNTVKKMTPTEKIILKWYGVNTFMYNKNDDRNYMRSLKNDVLLKIQQELEENQQYLSSMVCFQC